MEMRDIAGIFRSHIRGGLTGLICAGIVLLVLWFVTFMVAFGNPGPVADAYLGVAAMLLTGWMPLVILGAGYIAGTLCGVR